jgi:hypothetical protein
VQNVLIQLLLAKFEPETNAFDFHTSPELKRFIFNRQTLRGI